MADAKIVIKIAAEHKQLRRDLAIAERDAQRHFSKVASLEAKIDYEANKRSLEFKKSEIAKEYELSKKGIEKQSALVKKNEENVKKIREKYGGIDKLSEFSKKKGVNKGLLTIRANKLGIPLSELDKFEHAKSELGGSRNTLKQMQYEHKHITKPKYLAAKKELYKPSEKQQQLFSDLNSENAELKTSKERVAELGANLDKVSKKEKRVRLLFNIFNNMPHPIKNISKYIKGFGKSLKRAAVQGLLLRPIRQLFFGIAQGISAAARENALFNKSMGNLKGTLWTAITPAFNALMPVLARFIDYISNVIAYLGTLINTLFKLKPASKSAASSLAQSAKKGGGKDKNFASWDTVQQLQKKQGGISPTFEQDFSKAEEAMSELRKAVLEDDWYTVGAIMAGHLNSIIDTMQTWLNERFRPYIVEFSRNFGRFLTGAFDHLDWKKIGTTISDGINTISEALFSFFDAFEGKSLGLGLGELFSSLFTNLDFGMATKALSEMLIDLLDGITGIIQGFDFFEVGRALVNDIADVIKNINYSDITSSLFELLGSAIGGLVSGIAGIATGIIDVLREAWGRVTTWWYDVAYEDGEFTIGGLLKGILHALLNIGAWIYNNIFAPFFNGLATAFGITSDESEELKPIGEDVISGMLQGILDKIASIGTWIKDNIFEPIKEKFKTVFDIVGGIANAFKFVGEAIFKGIKEGAKALFPWLDEVANKWKNIKSHTGGYETHEDSEMRMYTPKALPQLAQGSVVNPGRKFAAVLGDNRYEQEVVSPLSTMKEALMDALQESGAMHGGNITLQVDGQTFARLINPYLGRETNRIGVRAIEGGLR